MKLLFILIITICIISNAKNQITRYYQAALYNSFRQSVVTTVDTDIDSYYNIAFLWSTSNLNPLFENLTTYKINIGTDYFWKYAETREDPTPENNKKFYFQNDPIWERYINILPNVSGTLARIYVIWTIDTAANDEPVTEAKCFPYPNPSPTTYILFLKLRIRYFYCTTKALAFYNALEAAQPNYPKAYVTDLGVIMNQKNGYKCQGNDITASTSTAYTLMKLIKGTRDIVRTFCTGS